MLAGVATLGVLVSAFAVNRYIQRPLYARLSPAQAEAAWRAAMAEPEKALELAAAKAKQTPGAEAEAEVRWAIKAYADAMERAEPFEAYHYWPYRERVRTQLREAARDLRGSGNVLRFARGLRHTLLPMLDRPSQQQFARS